MELTILTGRLGFDAETRTMNGKEYISMTIAHQRRKNDPTTWYHCYYYKTANNSTLLQYLKKGCVVGIQGNLSASIYTSKSDNQPKLDLTIWVNALDIIQFPKDETKEEPKPTPSNNPVEPDFPF